MPSASLMSSDPIARSLRSDPLAGASDISFMNEQDPGPSNPSFSSRFGHFMAENTTAGGLFRSATAENATPGQQGWATAGLGMMGLGMLAGGIPGIALSLAPMAIDYFQNNANPFASEAPSSSWWTDPDTKFDPSTQMATAPVDPVTIETTYDDSGGSWGGGDSNSGNWSAGEDDGSTGSATV
jgi:hypothetical protein